MEDLKSIPHKYILERFYELENGRDVASLLQVKYSTLVYYLFGKPKERQYTTFNISKRNNKQREICAPISSLKLIQQKLAYILSLTYHPKACVHGYIHSRSILTNAHQHAKRRHVFNIDIKDFYPSINFGRVLGLFKSIPYRIDHDAAVFLSNICCYRNYIPQGAPTSPVIANMICSKLDNQLKLLAVKYRCSYTRYADDITFSTNQKKFPNLIASYVNNKVCAGEEIRSAIAVNGFTINDLKTRLSSTPNQKIVTGLVVNAFPNVKRNFYRQARAMLHAWDKFGIENAEKEHYERYNKKHRHYSKGKPTFDNILRGKINFLMMVRGREDPLCLKLIDQYNALVNSEKWIKTHNNIDSRIKFEIRVEGPTDIIHLKHALNHLQQLGNYKTMTPSFFSDNSDTILLNFCRHACNTQHAKPIVCMFDRDNSKIIKQVNGDSGFKDWGGNIFSFPIPIPEHRNVEDEISIEHYYIDTDLTKTDSNGRRLFLSDEFDKNSQRLKVNPDISCTDQNRIKMNNAIISDKVWDKDSNSIALSKMKFANNIRDKIGNFRTMDLGHFKGIFDTIDAILKTL